MIKLEDAYDISLPEIINKKRQLQNSKYSGVYFLIHNNIIVYVGSSKTNVFARIFAHIADNDLKKEFDSYYCLSYPKYRVEHLEAYFIYKFKPKYNKYIPNNNFNIKSENLHKGVPILNEDEIIEGLFDERNNSPLNEGIQYSEKNIKRKADALYLRNKQKILLNKHKEFQKIFEDYNRKLKDMINEYEFLPQ